MTNFGFITMDLIAERAAHAETREQLESQISKMQFELAEADFGYGGWNSIRSRIERERDELRSQLAEMREQLAQAQGAAIEIAKAKSEQWIELIKKQEITVELLTALIKFHDRQECPWCYDEGQCDVADTITIAQKQLINVTTDTYIVVQCKVCGWPKKNPYVLLASPVCKCEVEK
jgi:predicted nucleic-acid-binding Zn-ribbon protein